MPTKDYFEIFTPGFSLSFLCPINTPPYLTTKHHTHDPIGPIGRKNQSSRWFCWVENDNDGIKIGLVGVKFHELYTTAFSSFYDSVFISKCCGWTARLRVAALRHFFLKEKNCE